MPSSSLIPKGDPTLLLTSAGMVQFKPYFLGEAVPPSLRLASCQKCFRATDIELVGDPSHNTFFEMLGNFSVGDYFKQETISWAWEFVTQHLGLPPQRLWITIFLEDDESLGYWQKAGVSPQRILRFGEQDNFWGPVGDSGPYGPCSEIFYDFGEEIGCGQPSCAPNCNCGRFSEIWNLVFTQYNLDKEGHRTLLPKPNIDTGMGLERTAAVMQGKNSVYETDLFVPLLECVSKLAKVKYGSNEKTDDAMRVIAEHSRGITFLIGDGVMPANEGRGYVLRRLLRRAALFSRRLGLDKPFLTEAAKTTIKQMGHIYPELTQRQDFILKIIALEEGRFSETLSTGLELIELIMSKQETERTGQIPGEHAFRLYDTYGFPVELTREIASGRGFSVDLDGFEKEMGKQRERAKASQKFVELTDKSKGMTLLAGRLTTATKFVGHHEIAHKSVITSILVEGEPIDAVQKGQEAGLILDTTPFYGEMGGQIGDTGEISSATGRFSVDSTVRMTPDIILHQGHVTEGSLMVEDKVKAEVARERRLDIARNHTATHLLQATLRQVLGEHVQQRGSLVTPERFTFDFSHLTAMTKEELRETQRIVNNRIRQNLAVYSEEIEHRKAIDEGAMALFDEKYGDIVRVVKIGEQVISAELCGGTHVASTGEIGFFHIFGEHSIGTGLRRIEAVTGREAETLVEQRLSAVTEMASRLTTEAEYITDKVTSLIAKRHQQDKRIQELESALARIRAETLSNQAEEVKGVMVLAARVPPSRFDVLREMSDQLKEQLESAVIVLGTVHQDKPVFLAAATPDLVARGYNAGEIVKQVAKVTGGGGGGSARLGQAGGKDRDKIDEALQLVKSLI